MVKVGGKTVDKRHTPHNQTWQWGQLCRPPFQNFAPQHM